MRHVIQPYKKKILLNPVDEYREQYPEASEQVLGELKELHQQYNTIKRLLEEARENANGISGKIGSAKKNGEPIDHLKSLMQEQSIRIREVTEQLDITESRILGRFETTHDSTQEAPSAIDMAPARIYSHIAIDPDTLTVKPLANEQDEWNAYISGNPAASIYHRAEWRDLIEKTFGHQCHYLTARDADYKIVGVLPLVHLKSRLFGDFMVSMPYFNYGGAIADHEFIEHRLMDAANQHARSLGVSHVEYRDDIPHNGFPVKTEKVNMILSLPASYDLMWDQFSSKLRSQIRRPQRENTRVEIGGTDFLDIFYSVFSRNMRDLGTPVYSKKFFFHILETFPENSKIIAATIKGRPAAAGFLLGYGEKMEIPWASTIREYNTLSINMLLYWESLKYAVDNNYRQFDFGRSSRESGTFRFKQQWGAVPKQSYWHYWMNKGSELPAINPGNPKYALMIRLWRRLPIGLTRWLGPLIVRNIP